MACESELAVLNAATLAKDEACTVEELAQQEYDACTGAAAERETPVGDKLKKAYKELVARVETLGKLMGD